MTEAAVIAKIIAVMIGAQVTGYDCGVGAFYHSQPGLMRDV